MEKKELKPCDKNICKEGKQVGNVYVCTHYNLLVSNGKLCEEWDYTKNKKKPEEYAPKSNAEVWWKCTKGLCSCHEWQASPNHRNRIKQPTGCPFCYGVRACEHNNLRLFHEKLCEEWDYDLNEKKPEDYTPGLSQNVFWTCKKNTSCNCHKWQAPICNRSKDKNPTGCPFCANQKVCIHGSLLYTHKELCLEWDHDKNELGPENYTYGSGYKASWICQNNVCFCHKWETAIFNRTNEKRPTGCPYCCESGGSPCVHYNLLTVFPDLAKEWDYERNNTKPESYLPRSNIKVHWICPSNPCGCHRYQATINNRSGNGRGCPYCSSKITCPHNNLLLFHGELCKEWNFEKNSKKPDEYSPSSGKKVWWKCGENHEWMATINSRTSKSQPVGCPHCSYNRGYSKAQIKWLESIMEEQNIKIQHAKSPEGEYKIEGIGKVDGYCWETSTCYEFEGDFFHGNPTMFNREDINPRTKKSYGELYDKTIEKNNKILAAGYKLVVKWETDFDETDIMNNDESSQEDEYDHEENSIDNYTNNQLSNSIFHQEIEETKIYPKIIVNPNIKLQSKSILKPEVETKILNISNQIVINNNTPLPIKTYPKLICKPIKLTIKNNK